MVISLAKMSHDILGAGSIEIWIHKVGNARVVNGRFVINNLAQRKCNPNCITRTM